MQLSEKSKKLIKNYENNPSLKTILPESEWKGTPVDEKGNFVNLEFPFETSFRDIYTMVKGERPQALEKKADQWKHTIIENDKFLYSDKDVIVWLGHATFFIRLNGKTILIDPVFYDLSIFLPRLSKLPLNPNLIDELDYILVSHNHRDHCDKSSLKLLAKNNPDATYLTSLRMDKYLKPWTKSDKIQTAGWYQQYKTEGLEVYFLPTRHWCRRYLWDLNTALWGSFLIRANGKTIYFGGDSGKSNHFKEVGELFDVDYTMIGTGAYKPEWIMNSSHTSPEEGFEAAKSMNAKVMIPMHYGTFNLSQEPPSEPIRKLRNLAKEEGSTQIKILKIGESFFI